MTDTTPQPATSDKAMKLAAIQSFFAAYANDDRAAIAAALAEDIAWTIPGHHPLSGTKRGIDEVIAFFDSLAAAGMKAETFFLEANDQYVVDIHRGYSTLGEGAVDTTWALVWHFNADGKVDRVVNLSGDQHQMDNYVWQNFELAPLPQRLA
jgi:ketosteroid isomerase-like protein